MTAPAGCPKNIYEEINNHLKPKFAAVDATKGLSLNFYKSVDIIKINRSELVQIQSSHPDFFKALRELNNALVFVTDGTQKAHLYQWVARSNKDPAEKWRCWSYELPGLNSVQNAIGAENNVFVLEANNALGPATPASPSTMPKTIFWLGQIISQTFKNINVPSAAPTTM